MRPQLVIPALITMFALAGCQIDEVDFNDDEIGTQSQASVGGTPANLAHHDSVAAITILLPLEEGQDPDLIQRTKFRYCTGVLVEDKVVMSAARCFARNLEAQQDDAIMGEYLDAASVKIQFGSSATSGTEYFLDATFDDGIKSVLGLTSHRYYDDDFAGTNDVALLRLSVTPVGVEAGVAPAIVNGAALGAAEENMLLELVGYGKNDSSGDPRDDFTARRAISPMIESISDTRVLAGSIDLTTCYADSGGPGFLDLGAGPVVATLNVLHTECAADIRRQRVDQFANDFVLPFIKFVSGECTPGNDCGDCDYNGICEEDCETRDWDCELGSFTGASCGKNGDCEEGGTCIPALDEPANTYCSKGCSADDATSCPSTMACVDDACIYDGISPGSQGATCSSPVDCRSGFCEALICANECDASDPNSCDTAAGFACLVAEAAGATATVCRVQSESGGGGFCAISAPGSSRGKGALAGFGLIFLLGLVLRRRS